MSLPRVIIRLAICASLTFTVSCGSSSVKFPKMNLLSVFKKKANDGKSADPAPSTEGDQNKKRNSAGNTAKGSAGSSNSKKKTSGTGLAGNDPAQPGGTSKAPDWNPGGPGGSLPVIVKPRQPSVDITPPTKGGTLEPGVTPEPEEPESGGLKPRKPTLEIVLPKSL